MFVHKDLLKLMEIVVFVLLENSTIVKQTTAVQCVQITSSTAVNVNQEKLAQSAKNHSY